MTVSYENGKTIFERRRRQESLGALVIHHIAIVGRLVTVGHPWDSNMR
jgi:hypothetical protein